MRPFRGKLSLYQIRGDHRDEAGLLGEDMGHLLHLDGPGQVVIGVVQEDLAVGLQGGLAGDDDLPPGAGLFDVK
jgi:hypothetical protein